MLTVKSLSQRYFSRKRKCFRPDNWPTYLISKDFAAQVRLISKLMYNGLSFFILIVQNCQACPSCLLMCFSRGSISESLLKKIKFDKVFQLLLKPCTFTLCRSCHFQQMLINFVSFDFFFHQTFRDCEKQSQSYTSTLYLLQ